ncbi:hypothetical protein [Streptomyces niveus]|uniref:hypothetical protein n=1 Tax=Streptomyces niveus TaxID=193462 RepID=UPI0038656A2A
MLPVVPRRTHHPGRKCLDDRKELSDIVFVLNIGIPWEFLQQKLVLGSGMTCRRRPRDWCGGWRLAASAPVAAGRAACRRTALDWSKAVIDSSQVRALKGGPKPDRVRSTVPDQAPDIT